MAKAIKLPEQILPMFIVKDSDEARSAFEKICAHPIKPGQIVFVSVSEYNAIKDLIAIQVPDHG